MSQIATFGISAWEIIRSPAFARGFNEVRAGRPLNTFVDDDAWSYERGRQFGIIAPRTMTLLNDVGKANRKAMVLLELAMDRGLIV